MQALAIRTGKVHVEHLPELPRSPVELFLDIEGVPDRDFHYLAGLLVCRSGEAEYESFWADDAAGEATMWSALIERLAAFPDSPVYHYGSYEKKAFATLAKRHCSGGVFSDRLVNVASSVYGKVYFPVRSNGLKPLGRFLGAAWTDPEASGLQSLVWRHRWEMTRDERFRQFPAAVQSRGLRGRPAAGRSPRPRLGGTRRRTLRSSLPVGRSGTRPTPGRRFTGSSSGS